jgi:hypothetical protein
MKANETVDLNRKLSLQIFRLLMRGGKRPDLDHFHKEIC